MDNTENLNLFIVPYMCRRDHETRRSPTRGEITLSVEAVDAAAAESIANLLEVASWSFLFLCIHVIICSIFISCSWQRTIIIISKVGRFGAILAQQFSVMTCSCHYKGVSTWVVPRELHSGDPWRQLNGKQEHFLSLMKQAAGIN